MSYGYGYYKVVRPFNGGLWSVCHDWAEKVAIKYTIGQFVISPYGPLYVFVSFQDTLRFASHDSNLEIWGCKVKNPRASRYILKTNFMRIGDLIRFHKGYETMGKISLTVPPQGTMVCDSVKLIRRIP